MRAILTVSIVALAILSCAPHNAKEVSYGEFNFKVTQDGEQATAYNYHTGRINAAALEEAARGAIARASGCGVRTIVKREEINIFDATLNCR